MQKRFLLLGGLASVLTLLNTHEALAQDEVVKTFNSKNVILPSSEYTPDETYTAEVWVWNTGQSYAESYYNQILGTPENDDNGLAWYEPDYELNDNTVIWQDATSPFSSDEYYNGHQSYRYVLSDIMAEIYIRRHFILSEELPEAVYLSAGHDDAPAEWYINGTLVHSVSDGWNNSEYVLLTDEQKALIKTDGSDNVIAVHVHQNWGGAFADCGLYAADITYEHTFLHTVADGSWPCVYYLLNSNDDIAEAEAGEWYALEEDESDWISGVGPFSNDSNMFYITEWPSQVRPILVRRHFTLTSTELEDIKQGDVKMLCSYDEDPKMYLNGTLIWSTTGWNDNDYAEVTLTDEQKALLREGDNVLAVSLEQGDGGGHIDYGLRLVSDDVLTGISVPHAATSVSDNDSRIYNISGQYVGKDTKALKHGIYIVGGKKRVIGK